MIHHFEYQRRNKPRDRQNTPFLLLANKVPPMYWQHFVGVTLDRRLGFAGSRQFHNLGQAITWAKSPTSASWSIRNNLRPVNIQTLIDCTSGRIPKIILNDVKQRLGQS